MILLELCLVVAASCGSSVVQETPLQEAVRLTGEGAFTQALRAADRGADVVTIAQARLYVLHHAGALDEALEAGLLGLASAPEDTWLLDQCARLAMDLGASELATRLVSELSEALPASESERARSVLEDARALSDQRMAERSALRRSRIVTAALTLAATIMALIMIRTGLAASSRVSSIS